MLDIRPVAGPGTFIADRNPVAKLGVAAVMSLTVLTSVDWFTPLLTIAVTVLLLPATGVRLTALARRLRFVLVAAGSVVLIGTLFAADKTGTVLVDFGPVLVTSTAVDNGVALGLRVVAVAVPGFLVFTTTDPTDLADSLIQQLHVPARFAVGALAALRLLPILAIEWQMLTMARRARGLDSGGNPVAAVRLFASTVFGLLVAAIRRATRLATAMDARGFDSAATRSNARVQRVTSVDHLMLITVVVLCVAILVTSVLLGHHRAIWS